MSKQYGNKKSHFIIVSNKIIFNEEYLIIV